MSGGGLQTSGWFAENAPTIPKGSGGAPKAPSTAVSSPASPQAIQGGSGDWFASNAPPTAKTQPTAPETGVWAGIKRNTVGMVSGLYHAFTDPATDQEKADLLAKLRADNAQGDKIPEDLATNPSLATLAVHRLLTNPSDLLNAKSDKELQAAQNLWNSGEHWKAANMSVNGAVDKVLHAIPLAGPMINSIAERAEGGDVSGAATDVAAAVALSKAGDIARATPVVGKVIKTLEAPPLGETMTTPRGTIPAEQFTPAELKAYADQNGIDLNAAQATGHNLPRSLQTAGERAAVGGTAIKQQIAASQASLADHVEGLASKMSPQTPDITTAGRVLKTSVQNALDAELTKADLNYSKVDASAQGTTVDLKDVKATADRILSDSNILQKAGLDPKTATRVLKGIGELDDNASFTDAQKLRSALLDLSRSPELAISTTAQGMLKQVIGATDQAMMDAAQSTPELQKAFRSANAHYEQLQEDFNSPRSPMNQILEEPDPNKVPQKLTARGQIGGSPYNAGLLDKYAISKAPLKSVILNDLYNRNFGLYGKTLGGYSDDFLNSVFDKPGELDSVYKTGAIARSIGLNVNPSGTAGATSAIEQVASKGGLLKGAKQTAAAKLTNSPHFNRWLMQVTGEPLPSSKGPRLATFAAGAAGGKQNDEEQ
jgi:hypothetical protein